MWLRPPLPFHLGFVPGSMIEREAERRNSQKRGVGIPRAALQRQVGACDNFLVRPGNSFRWGCRVSRLLGRCGLRGAACALGKAYLLCPETVSKPRP